MAQVKGRFAPSPSGRMHLGNVFCALLAWLSVRSQNGSLLLRIEDLDPARYRTAYAGQLENDLRWLGLPWDEGGVNASGPHAPYCQSRRSAIYERLLSRLAEHERLYPAFAAATSCTPPRPRTVPTGGCGMSGAAAVWRKLNDRCFRRTAGPPGAS